jgi:hypothetical protein
MNIKIRRGSLELKYKQFIFPAGEIRDRINKGVNKAISGKTK